MKMDKIKRLMQKFCEENELEPNPAFHVIDESEHIVPGVLFKIKSNHILLVFADYKDGSWKETERFELRVK